jgi:hypothetical protein
MKKLILILTILVLAKSQAISQTAYDSVTSIPNYQLKKAINLIEKGKVTQKELDFTKEKVITLESRIKFKDSVINKYVEKEVVWNKMDKNYKEQIRNYNEFTQNCNRIYAEQRLLINRGKWEKWLFLAVGIGGGILLHK